MSPIAGGGGEAGEEAVVDSNDDVHHYEGHHGSESEEPDQTAIDGTEAHLVVLSDDEDVFLPIEDEVGDVGRYQGVDPTACPCQVNLRLSAGAG